MYAKQPCGLEFSFLQIKRELSVQVHFFLYFVFFFTFTIQDPFSMTYKSDYNMISMCCIDLYQKITRFCFSLSCLID